MKKTRPVKRVKTRNIEKMQTKKLNQNLVILTKNLQIALEAIYQVLIEKGVITLEEYQKKCTDILSGYGIPTGESETPAPVDEKEEAAA